MSMEQYMEFKRTENGSNIGEASKRSVEEIVVKSGKAVAVNNVREKNKYSEPKSTINKSSRKSSGKKKSEASSSISAAMDDLRKFSKSLIDELKDDYQKMLEQMKKDLGNLGAADSNLKTRKSKGKLILRSGHGQEKKKIHSEPLHEQNTNPSSSRNFNKPAGQLAGNTGFDNARDKLMRRGNLSYPHQNTSGSKSSSRFPRIPIQEIFPPGSFPDNYFRDINFYEEYEMHEASRLRAYGRNDSTS